MDTPLPPQQTNTIPTSPAPAPYTPPPAPAPVPFVPPVAPSQPPMNTPLPSGSHTGLLVGILIVVLLLAVAYYFFFLTSGDATVTPTPSVMMSPIVIQESPSLSPSPSSMASVSWQTYSNEQYGFEISTPPSWSGRVVTVTIPSGRTANVQIAYSPTAQLPAQSAEVLVYTTAQWDAELLLDQPHPTKIGQSGVYVFATPVRLESSGLPGEADVPGILSTFKLTR